MRPCPEVLYIRAATIDRWVDGDTVDVIIDQGFRATRTERLRLRGCDTPERREKGWAQAGQFARQLAPPGAVVTIQTFHPVAETFGRYVADLWTTSGDHLPTALIEAGLAKPYPG